MSGLFDWFMVNFEVTPFGMVLLLMGCTFAFFVIWRQEAIVRAVTKFEEHVKGNGGTDEKVNQAVGALSVLLKQRNQ